MTTSARVSGPEPARIDDCERVLRALPDYFGIEESLVRYLKDIETRPTYHAWLDGRMVGFLSVTRHTPESAEIHVMGVVPEEHRKGIGSGLVESAEKHLRRDRVVLFEVKTLGESHPDQSYKLTRAFYRAKGFIPLEEIPHFWGKKLPTLFLVKPLLAEPHEPDRVS